MEDTNIVLCTVRCDVADGIDLAEGACKLRMNVHSVCHVGNFCICWATACCANRQCCGLDDQGIIHHFLVGKIFLSSSDHPDNL